ncbi:hypothetical protein NE237_015183 [Protea cynaroides]|uniref:Uncharacterized protein n=1 Tax=Protea cynaroides TaxID=273540 RepID=A0A9Q0KDK0_9MAGN|nr:hypothetical protein NE237_015183 [Protea cynaroides]
MAQSGWNAGHSGASSSFAPPPDFDAFWFRSAHEQDCWHLFQHKHIESGHFIDLDELEWFREREAFSALGWLAVLQFRTKTRPNLVWHLYANLRFEGNFEGDGLHSLCITSRVWGVDLSFGMVELANALGISVSGDCVFVGTPKISLPSMSNRRFVPTSTYLDRFGAWSPATVPSHGCIVRFCSSMYYLGEATGSVPPHSVST